MIQLMIDTIRIICPKYRLHWYISKWYTALITWFSLWSQWAYGLPTRCHHHNGGGTALTSNSIEIIEQKTVNGCTITNTNLVWRPQTAMLDQARILGVQSDMGFPWWVLVLQCHLVTERIIPWHPRLNQIYLNIKVFFFYNAAPIFYHYGPSL